MMSSNVPKSSQGNALFPLDLVVVLPNLSLP